MDQAFHEVLAAYNERATREEELMLASMTAANAAEERNKYLLHVGEDVAYFLHSLAVARQAKTILELGTSYGYSTLFLADAARKTGGKVITLELDGAKQAYAREQLEKAGLAHYVEWLQGDALELLAGLSGPFDLVLLDLWKELYIPCLELIYDKIPVGGIIAADNILYPEIVRPDAKRYQDAVRAKSGFEAALLPIGQGIDIASYWPA